MGSSLPLAPCGLLRSATAAVLLAVVLCATVSLARVVSPVNNSVGGACRLASGRSGECRLVMDCPSAVEAIRRTARRGTPNTQHRRCGFKGTVEIVCCETETGSGGTRHRPSGGVRYNPGNRDPAVGNRRPWLPGGGGRPRQDSQWLPGTNRGGGRRTGRPTAPQRVERRAATACRVYSSKCPKYVNTYIIGGTEAGLGGLPHMAALGYKSNNMGESMIKWDCGGTLISDRYVMTAAHCTKKLNGPVVVRLGDHNLASDDEGASPVDFAIEKIEKHPSYSSDISYHDIALLRLSRSVNFTEFICPACLYLGGDPGIGRRDKFDISFRMAQEDGENSISNSFEENEYGSAYDYELGNRMLWDGEEVGPRFNNEDDLRDKNLFISGWGATSYPGGDRSPVLMLAKIEPFSSNECNVSLYEANGRSISLIPRGLMTDLQICAGDRKGKKDTCFGDSGGPLQYKGKDSSSLLTVVGVTSFGIKCGFPGVPGVYTRVSSYVDWIEQKVWPQGMPS